MVGMRMMVRRWEFEGSSMHSFLERGDLFYYITLLLHFGVWAGVMVLRVQHRHLFYSCIRWNLWREFIYLFFLHGSRDPFFLYHIA